MHSTKAVSPRNTGHKCLWLHTFLRPLLLLLVLPPDSYSLQSVSVLIFLLLPLLPLGSPASLLSPRGYSRLFKSLWGTRLMLAWTPSSDASCLKTSNSFSFPFCPLSFALFTLLCLEAGKMRETEKENGFFFFFCALFGFWEKWNHGFDFGYWKGDEWWVSWKKEFYWIWIQLRFKSFNLIAFSRLPNRVFVGVWIFGTNSCHFSLQFCFLSPHD